MPSYDRIDHEAQDSQQEHCAGGVAYHARHSRPLGSAWIFHSKAPEPNNPQPPTYASILWARSRTEQAAIRESRMRVGGSARISAIAHLGKH